jgi:hypothetical protein
MNTGIGDAVDLAWKLEARLKGFGGQRLLASYEAERRPIGLSNTIEAADNYARSGEIFFQSADVEDTGARGCAAREAIAQQLPPKIKHFAPIGVHLGYAYENSPIIVRDGTPAPPRETAAYTPRARPGHRAPHFWLAPGRSSLDLFGRGFALLCFGTETAAADSLADAARESRLPLAVYRIDNHAAAALYEKRFVLVRPDGHVAWRGDAMPARPREVVAIVSGHAERL